MAHKGTNQNGWLLTIFGKAVPHSWTTPSFKIHTPPVENFGKVYHGGVWIWKCTCVNIRLNLSQREWTFYFEVLNKLSYLKFTLPLCQMFLKSSTGGVCNSNQVTHVNTGTLLVYQYCGNMRYSCSSEQASVILKFTILEHKNYLNMSNTPTTNIWDLTDGHLFPNLISTVP